VRDTTGLPPGAVALLRDAARTLGRGEIKAAEQSITLALVYAP
jgi:Flp pilus assembly protein TadD